MLVLDIKQPPPRRLGLPRRGQASKALKIWYLLCPIPSRAVHTGRRPLTPRAHSGR